MAEDKQPQTTHAPTTELEGAEPVERRVMEPYRPSKGWVKDPNGRFHEVDDVDRFMAAYPGSEKVKLSEVVKSRVGYEDAAPAAQVEGTQPEG